MSIEIYTDGSCHTQKRIGAWAAIIFFNEEKIILSGTEKNTTHNRMEILAVIKSLEYTKKNYKSYSYITVVSDSQYVVGLNDRKEKLNSREFITKKGTEIRNADLVKEFYSLSSDVSFVKIKAHQKKPSSINYNIEVDKICRQLVREEL